MERRCGIGKGSFVPSIQLQFDHWVWDAAEKSFWLVAPSEAADANVAPSGGRELRLIIETEPASRAVSNSLHTRRRTRARTCPYMELSAALPCTICRHYGTPTRITYSCSSNDIYGRFIRFQNNDQCKRNLFLLPIFRFHIFCHISIFSFIHSVFVHRKPIYIYVASKTTSHWIFRISLNCLQNILLKLCSYAQ